MQITYRDIVIDVKKGTAVKEILKSEIEKSEEKVIACKFNNEIKSLNFEINKDGNLELIDLTSKDGMRIYKRGLIYIICKAFKELYDDIKITIDYQLFHSMYCTTDNLKITDEVIKQVTDKVDEIIKRNLPIERKVMTKEEAKLFYEKNNTLKGKLQLDLETKKEVTLYYCEDYYNYFYGVLPINTGFITKYSITKYQDGILIRYPNEEHPNELIDFVDTPKLFDTLQEYKSLHKFMNVNTLYKINTIIKAGKIKDYILLDEALHEKKIASIADIIAKNKNIKLIAIAGPSSSGKTTFAKRLSIQLRINGIKPITISVDDYFIERKDTPKDKYGNYDYESIDAIDKTLLNNNLMKLFKGEEIDAPTFDFYKGTKFYDGKKMKLAEDEVLIMEGIHCLNDELTYLVPKENKFKIYVSALTVLNIDYYNRISTTDTRLIRRIARDYKYRGYTAEHVLKMWPAVNKGETNNIFRFQEEADVMFNSSLIYELCVLKNQVVPLLKAINPTSEYYSEAKRLYSMLSYFEPIATEDVPSNSILREFIGGSIFN
ncbi:MAG: nucleoside kinase [Clostridia bacterium]